MIVLPSDPDCFDLLMKTDWYQNVIMTGNSSLNIKKWSRKKLLNDFIHAYLINFCSLYIYKMYLFILLLLIMLIFCLIAEVRVEARGQGINVTGVIMTWWHKVGIHDSFSIFSCESDSAIANLRLSVCQKFLSKTYLEMFIFCTYWPWLLWLCKFYSLCWLVLVFDV